MRTIVLDRVDSTNDYLKKIVTNYPDIADLLSVISNEQTKGKGRFNRKWFSSEDSLTFSILLYSSENIYQLSLVVANSLLLAIKENCGINKVYIKWPNDVYINDKKVAGILLENIGKYVIIGVGINVNQEYFPPDLENAISIKMAKKEKVNKDEFYEIFMKKFLKNYRQWLLNPASTMSEIKTNIGWKGRRVKVSCGDRIIVGIIEGIDINGFLMLKDDNNVIEKIASGEISLCLLE